MPFNVMSIADIHLTGGFETDEAQALMKAAQVAKDEDAQVVCVNGDIYHAKSTPIQRAVFKQFLNRLTEADISVVILRGNHDEEGDLSVFHDPQRNIHVFEQAGNVQLGVHNSDWDLVVHAIPHFNAGKLALEAQSLADLGETGTGLFDQIINGIFNEVRATDHASIVLFHGVVDGAHLDNGMIPKQDGIHLNGTLLAALGCPVRGGHYHEAQESYPNVRYSGSITLRNYGENGDKGVLIDTYEQGKHTECRFVSLAPSARITIDAEWVAELSSFLVEEAEDHDSYNLETVVNSENLQGARVRFRYKIHQSEVATLDLGPTRRLFEDAGVRELKLERDLIIETAIRSEAMQKANSVIEMHETWLQLKGLEEKIPSQREAYNRIVTGIEPVQKPQLELLEGTQPRETAIA